MEISGKVALVTGAGGGIGAALSRRPAEAGAAAVGLHFSKVISLDRGLYST